MTSWTRSSPPKKKPRVADSFPNLLWQTRAAKTQRGFCNVRWGNAAVREIGLWRAVKARGWLDALPPAFTRGVPPVRTLVAGGARHPHIFSQNGTKIRIANTEREYCLMLCCRKFVLPPPPVCALEAPPSQVRGARAAAPPVRQITFYLSAE